MGLLRDIQSEIERRRLSGGGWANGNGSRAEMETTCYALMALQEDDFRPIQKKAIDLLRRTQNPDGSWPAFDGDDREGCWTTSLAVIAVNFVHSPLIADEHALRWLLKHKGREGHWLWNWKFRTLDRAVQFNPDKYGWPWFPGTVSWVIPTVFSLIAIRQSFRCCRPLHAIHRIRLGMEMLRDRACPLGGWNAGNGIVFGAPLQPHIDTTAIALLALTEKADPFAVWGLDWLRQVSITCSSPYSLAWCAIAFRIHQDPALDRCIADLYRVLLSTDARPKNIEALSLAVIAIKAAEDNVNPFHVVI